LAGAEASPVPSAASVRVLLTRPACFSDAASPAGAGASAAAPGAAAFRVRRAGFAASPTLSVETADLADAARFARAAAGAAVRRRVAAALAGAPSVTGAASAGAPPMFVLVSALMLM